MKPGLPAFIVLGSISLAIAHLQNPSRLQNFGPQITHRTYVPEPTELVQPLWVNNPLDIALEFASKHLTNSDFKVKSSYKSDHNGVTHVYLRQVVNGIEVINGDININVDASGTVISHGNSFYRGKDAESNEDDYDNEDQEYHIMSSDKKFQVTVDFSKITRKLPGKKSSTSQSQDVYHINNKGGAVISPEDALFSFAKHINHEIPHPEKIEYTESVSLDGEPTLTVKNVPFVLSDVTMSQVYIQLDDNTLQLCWDIQAEMEENWYHVQVDAHDGKLLALMDWVADASYNVFPLGLNDPSEGGRHVVVDPADKIASPFGWHSQGNSKNFTVTIGNNVYAHENLKGNWEWEDNYRPEGGELLEFNFPLYLEEKPKKYINSSVTNLFYWNNLIHDLFYRYGFNEVSGNFQENNHGKGGKGQDAVIANAQDGSGYNNANFATPPDGQRGKMRMYVWDVINPWRDGDLEAGIIIHEYSHGISTRLTGGPHNSGCLGWGEAGGMGEGWGDFFATILRMKPEMTRKVDFGMGDWANGGEGIRRFKYSTSKKTNPETFAWMDKPGYWGVHAKGAVWAEMLYEVYWNLVDKHGFTLDWFPPVDEDELSDWYVRPKKPKKPRKPRKPKQPSGGVVPKHGNTLMLQLVVDGLKLQPCRPTFVNARDAILQADEILTGGENSCEIWHGFAKRGLGKGAKLDSSSPWGDGTRKESFKVPADCKKDDYSD